MSNHGIESAQVWQACFTCRDYAQHRRQAIAEPLAAKARREGREVIAVVDEFMLSVHERHLRTGQPVREGGPTRVTDPRIGRLMATYGLLGSMVTPPGVSERPGGDA